MQWIPEYLVKNVTYSNNDQTLYIDLPKNEQISFLALELSCQGSATPRTTTTLVDAIDSYQVMADGSGVLFNLEPELAYYIDFITRGGIYPAHSHNYTPNGRELHEFIIPFGRHMFDEEYLLDTSLYKACQLRIPYDVSGSEWTSATFRANVVMYRPLNKLRPLGFIRSRAVRKESCSAAAQTVMHDLPMSYPLRYVAARFEDIDANLATNLTSAKVNIDEGRLVLADLNSNEWRDLDKKRWPEKSYYQIVPAATDATYFKAHTDYPYPRALFSSGVRALIFKLSAAVGEQCALNVYEADGTTASGGHAVTVQVGGPNPHKCLTMIDGRDEAFPAPSYSQGKIEYTVGATSPVIHTFVQEVVTGRL